MKLTRCNKCVTGKNEITLFPDPARQFPGGKAERGAVSCPDQEGGAPGSWKHRENCSNAQTPLAEPPRARGWVRPRGRACVRGSHTRAREFHDTEALRSHHRFVIWAPWVFPKSGL